MAKDGAFAVDNAILSHTSFVHGLFASIIPFILCPFILTDIVLSQSVMLSEATPMASRALLCRVC
jgi:hypothetical protein